MDCRQVCALLCVERGARPVPAPVPHCKRLENGTCNPVPHRLATSFGVSQDAVAAFLEQDDVQAALRQLLEGTGGVSKLLIFYQSRDDITPVRRTACRMRRQDRASGERSAPRPPRLPLCRMAR